MASTPRSCFRPRCGCAPTVFATCSGRGATVVSPFIVLALFKSNGVAGVLGLMIGLLVIQIIVVAIWGIETNRRGLEELEAAVPRPASA